jgi:hypothetical protein
MALLVLFPLAGAQTGELQDVMPPHEHAPDPVVAGSHPFVHSQGFQRWLECACVSCDKHPESGSVFPISVFNTTC